MYEWGSRLSGVSGHRRAQPHYAATNGRKCGHTIDDEAGVPVTSCGGCAEADMTGLISAAARHRAGGHIRVLDNPRVHQGLAPQVLQLAYLEGPTFPVLFGRMACWPRDGASLPSGA